jgi:hypothetical protein
VELEGGGRLVLYQQNAFDAAGPSEGDGVSVSWDAQNCLVLGRLTMKRISRAGS